MADYSRQETADRGGVTLDEVTRLVDLGILTPTEDDRFTAGDARKIGIVQTIERAGMSVEGFGALMRNRDASLDFMDSPLYARFATLSPITFQTAQPEVRGPGRVAHGRPRGDRRRHARAGRLRPRGRA